MTTFSAFCPGEPIPQGSMKAFLCNLAGVRRGERPIISITSDNPKLKAWREAQAKLFAIYAKQQGIIEPLDGPLACGIVFIIPRLAGHPKTKEGRRAPDTGRDLDKLIRATWDALKEAQVIKDDSRICLIQRPIKRFAKLTETPGVIVRIWPIEETELEEAV